MPTKIKRIVFDGEPRKIIVFNGEPRKIIVFDEEPRKTICTKGGKKVDCFLGGYFYVDIFRKQRLFLEIKK